MVYWRLILVLSVFLLPSVLALPLEDSTTYYPEKNLCLAEKSGLYIGVENCLARDIDKEDITHDISFKWTGGQDKDLDWIFAYDGNLSDFSIFFNGTGGEWVDKTNKVKYKGYDLLGKGWTYYKVVNQTMEAGRLYKTRWVFTPENKSKTGKWRIFGKLAAQSIAEAVEANQYIFVDPWWDDICGDFTCPEGTWATGNNWTIYNTSGNAVFGTTTFPSTGRLTQDVGLSATKREYNITLSIYRTWFNWTEIWVELGGTNSSKFTSEGDHKFFHTTDGIVTNLTIWANRTYEGTIDAYLVLNNITIVNSGRILEVDFDAETPDNASIVYEDFFYVNNTFCGVNFFENMTYYLYNSSGDLINETFFDTPHYEINWTNLSDGIYYFNISATDFNNAITSTETRQVTVEATLDVAWCREIWKANAVYTQTQDIEAEGYTNCIRISGTNTTFEGNDFEIINGGIYLGRAYNSTINNTKSNKISLTENSEDNLIKNSYINNCSEECILIGEGFANIFNNNFENIILNNSNKGISLIGTNTFGLLVGSENTTFKNIQFLNITNYSVYMPTITRTMTAQSNKNVIFINSSFEDEYVSGANNDLTKKWYYQAKVNDSDGNDLENASVLVYDNTETLIHNSTTDSSGIIDMVEIVEYQNSAGATTYYSNYSIIAEKESYPNLRKHFNVSIEHNSFNNFFTLNKCSSPSIGHWTLNCSLNCAIGGEEVPENITMTGSGTTTIDSSLYFSNNNWQIYKTDGCDLFINNGG